MEKQLFIALGLHLWTERQLYWLICCVCHIELIIMLKIMWRKKIFVEKSDIIYFISCIQMLAVVLFKWEHITFFFSIFYISLFLMMMYFICKYYTED